MPIRKVSARIKQFRERKHQPVTLPFPVTPTLRLAQLSPGPAFVGVKPLAIKRWAEVQTLRPNVVLGSTGELQRLAEQASLGTIDASSIDHAVVVITGYGTRPLNDRTRVALWQSFGVPIFELYLALDNSLLASECEAHEGWHLAAGVEFAILGDGELMLDGAGNTGLRTGLKALHEIEPCPCGRPEPRLLEIEPLCHQATRYLAASA